MTRAERLLWQHLRGSQLAGLHFRRQQVVDGVIVDFYCHQAGLVVELDGEVHEDRQEYDAERDGLLRGRELIVLRFRNEQVFTELGKVLAAVREAARERRLPTP
jgi:very-short-patch-repair endonuclease